MHDTPAPIGTETSDHLFSTSPSRRLGCATVKPHPRAAGPFECPLSEIIAHKIAPPSMPQIRTPSAFYSRRPPARRAFPDHIPRIVDVAKDAARAQWFLSATFREKSHSSPGSACRSSLRVVVAVGCGEKNLGCDLPCYSRDAASDHGGAIRNPIWWRRDDPASASLYSTTWDTTVSCSGTR